MPPKTPAAPAKKKRRSPKRVYVPPVYADRIPAGATHFRLRKGGRNAPNCTVIGGGGVEVVHHPIEMFTTATIAQRWGYDPHYWVLFLNEDEQGKRKSLGASRHLGLHDPAELGPQGIEVEGGTVLPGPMMAGSGQMSEALAMTLHLKSIAEKDSDQMIRREQVRADQHTTMMMKMFESSLVQMTRLQPAPPSSEMSPALLMLLQGMQSQAAATNALLARIAERDGETEEEEEEVELTDDQKLERFKKLWKAKGVAALPSLLGEETLESAFRWIPKLKARLPDAWAKIQPLLEQQMKGLLEPAPAPAAAPVVQNPPPQRPQMETRVNDTNGAPPPPPRRPVRDKHTPIVE
jgi:hypothetical protein